MNSGVISIYNKYIDRDIEAYRAEAAEKKSPLSSLFGGASAEYLKGILPPWLDAGDLALMVLLFLLYLENDDSDFLIILAVVAFAVMKDKDD